MIMANAGAANMSIRLGWQGPCETTVTACASGTHALGNAGRLVASGRLEVALAIGAESTLIGVARAGFANMTALSQSGISRPFDKERDGFVMAEGAAALVLEEWDRAVARGAHIYGELAGAASSADAFHITAPAPAGSGAAACMELALHDARVSAEEIVHINAHGTSTPLNDSAEAEAINKVFGVPGPPVTSIKGVTGHALGAAGAIEAVSVLLSYEHRLIPPTAGLVDLDPAVNLDVVHPTARPFEPGPVISNSFGFGGHNGCLVFKPASHQQS
jgi:3-oxoacyl-[acyl-carrier-protein] synthase II